MKSTKQNNKRKNKTIIFYDGSCGICNRFIRLLLAIDKQKEFHFAPLQGVTAKKLLPSHLTLKIKTVIVKDQNTLYTYSDAILHIFSKLHQPWQFFYVFILIPQCIRDTFYKIFARYRKKIPLKECRILTKEEKKKIFRMRIK